MNTSRSGSGALPVLVAALVVGGLLPALAGCAPAPKTSAQPALDLSVALVQNRSDAPAGRLQLRVTNGSAEDLQIRAAVLESTVLAAPAVWDTGTTVPAGATRDLPVQFPGASCVEGKPRMVVRFEVGTAAGPGTVEVTPTDPNGRMPLLASTECFARAVSAVGEVSLAGLTVADPAEPAKLQVRVDSAGTGKVLRIRSVESTVLFAPLDASGAPAASAPVDLELRPGEADATALVELVPSRCDPHALAEDKVGTLFVLKAEVEGGPAGSITLPASAELRGRLYDYFASACAL